MSSPEELPYFDSGENIVPTIHVKDLAKIVKQLLVKKPEKKYIFAIDYTKDCKSKDLISSISRGVGTGKTTSIPSNENFIKNLNFNNLTDHHIDPEKYKSNNLNLILTENELNWQVYLSQDVMLKRSKLFDPNDFTWHCQDFNKSIPVLLKEFCKYRQLRPLKIVLNCEDEYKRCVYADNLAKFYNIPIININTIINMLSLNEEDLDEEELFMYKKYLASIKKLEEYKNNGPDETDPTFNDEEILFDVLKNLLVDNQCLNRGYVLEGIPSNKEQVQRLYNKKIEIKNEGDDDMDNIDNDMDMDIDMDMDNEEHEDSEKGDDKNLDNSKKDADGNDDLGDKSNIKNDIADKSMNNKNDKVNMNDMSEDEEKEMEEVKEKPKEESIFIDKQDQIDEEERQAKIQAELEAKSKKKNKKKKEVKKRIKLKKFKQVFMKKLLPESVITIGFKNSSSGDKSLNDTQDTSINFNLQEKDFEDQTNIKIKNPFWEVEDFYQQQKIEVLNVIADKNQDEVMEIMRIYIEREGRPYNYFNENEKKIHEKRNKLLETKKDLRNKINQKEEQIMKEEETVKKDLFWEKMNKRIADIRKDKEEILSNNEKTRKFLLLNIMPILTKGMLEVCKIDPIDPIDYLADYLFEKSTG